MSYPNITEEIIQKNHIWAALIILIISQTSQTNSTSAPFTSWSKMRSKNVCLQHKSIFFLHKTVLNTMLQVESHIADSNKPVNTRLVGNYLHLKSTFFTWLLLTASGFSRDWISHSNYADAQLKTATKISLFAYNLPDRDANRFIDQNRFRELLITEQNTISGLIHQSLSSSTVISIQIKSIL